MCLSVEFIRVHFMTDILSKCLTRKVNIFSVKGLCRQCNAEPIRLLDVFSINHLIGDFTPQKFDVTSTKTIKALFIFPSIIYFLALLYIKIYFSSCHNFFCLCIISPSSSCLLNKINSSFGFFVMSGQYRPTCFGVSFSLSTCRLHGRPTATLH